MPDHAADAGHAGLAASGAAKAQAPGVPVVDELGEEECLRLVSGAEVGRIAYRGRYGPSVLPVNYKLHDRTVVFRTAISGAMGQDLRTGITDAELRVAFEVDDIDMAAREGWSVLIQGPAHHVDDPAEREAVLRSGVQPWPGGEREHFIRITPVRITGRRIRHAG